MSKPGFDPERLQDGKRERAIIPQILSADTPALAKGFTEIKVVGLGGAGNNTVDRMIESGVQGIDFIAVNSDVQALANSHARKRLQIGERLTHGLGAGGDARIGERAADNARDVLHEALTGADMVFITAGLGGGIGSGAAAITAETAQQCGALTVGVLSLPFSFEGTRRRTAANEAIDRIRPFLDSIIVVSNDRLLQTSPARGIRDSFRLADETLNQGIHGIADLILTPGLINLDFADVNSIMRRSGSAMMAMGVGSGEDRAGKAVDKAMNSALLDSSISGARGVLLNITGGPDLTLFEVNQAAEKVSSAVAPECNIIFGAVIHPRLGDEIRITIIATGFGKA